MQVARVYPERKVRLWNKIKEYASKYKTIALIKMEKVRSEQIMAIRKKFGDELKILMVKNKIAMKALSGLDVKGIDKLLNELRGQNAFIFTDINPFKLYLLLEKEKVYLPAKGGDVATDEIMVPAGNTGLPPGPILSEFREAKIPTKIEGGTVWISNDTIVAKPGDVIDHKLASLLSKLDIKPIKAGLSIYLALEDGLLYKSDDLKIDLDATLDEIKQSHAQALNLAVNSGYPTRESIEHIVRKAYTDARALAVNSGYPDKEVISDILAKADIEARALLEEAKKKGYQ